MPTPIETTLSTLLPTLNIIPPELINLASSLLSQSRSKAPLKPDEEICRTYACCHLACERLSSKLGLEVEKPKPPVPPRIYQKLYGYLESTLKNAPNTPKTNRIKDVVSGAATPVSARRGNGTPSKAVKLAVHPLTHTNTDVTPTSSRRSAKRSYTTAADSEVLVPPFVMPLVRKLCKEFGTPQCAPHVFAGVASIIRHLDETTSQAMINSHGAPYPKRRKTDELETGPIAEARTPGLVIVVYFYTAARMLELETSPGDYVQRREEAITVLMSFFKWGANMGPPPQTAKQIAEDVEFFMRRAQNGWLDMEWYQNVPEPEGYASEGEEEDDDLPKRPSKTPLRRKEKPGILETEGASAAGLLPGLGTMFQPAIDWLSDERRDSYAVWKQNIMSQIEVIESR